MKHLKEFTKAFDAAAYGHNRGSLFASFVEIAALTIHQTPYHQGLLPQDEAFERIEQQYMTEIKRIDREIIDLMGVLYATASMGVMENKADFLGAAYMQMEMGNDHAGQFFTPPEVSRLMAEMTFGASDIIKEKGFVTVSDPAGGAGRMLIEAANAIERKGFDPRDTMYFECRDIDKTCFNMAYFQLSTLGLAGEVVHGNTLSMETWETRPTPQLRLIEAAIPETPVERQRETPAPETPRHDTPMPPQKPVQFSFDLKPPLEQLMREAEAHTRHHRKGDDKGKEK